MTARRIGHEVRQPRRVREMDDRVSGAAANVGLPFRLDLTSAHAQHDRCASADLVRRPRGDAGRRDGGGVRRYFTQGRDIGDRDVLADCAAEGGMGRVAVADFLAGDMAAGEMLAADRAAREAG